MSHLLLDIDQVAPRHQALINSAPLLEQLLRRVATATGATILGSLAHQFQPQGATVILLLAESHLSAHSWPERRAIRIDYYHCGQTASDRLEHAVNLFREHLAGSYNIRLLER
jgi:S-adenosylmethionine decarboxylase